MGISKNIHALHANFEDVEADSVTITDNTTSSSATTGALKVVGGISTQENLNVGAVAKVISATDASSKTTGALIVTGGVGISKNIHALHANFEDVEADSVTVTDTTTSDSATTGALKVAGGISTQENLNVGAVAKVISATDATSKTTGALIVTGGLGVAKNIHGKNVFVEDIVSNSVVILDTTVSSSKTTGALIVAGGLGVAANIHTSNIYAGYDADETSYIGRSAIGFMGQSDHASFAHVDNNTTTNYALKQSAAGTTHLNAKSGQNVSFKINNAEKARLTSAGDFFVDTDTLYVDAGNDRVGVNTASPEAKLHVVGNAYVSSTTDATTTTTGALIVAGGLGIAKKIVGQHASFEDVTATSVTASAMVKGATISGTNVYGTLAGANTAAVTTLTASGMVKGATISGTNVYGTLAGANTAAVTTLTASAMVKGATISGTNVYGTLAGANTAAVTSLTASAMVKGATISGTNVYGTLAGANTAAVTTLTASAMVKGATISGTNVYGTLAGSNAAAITTLNASGVVTLADDTSSTSATTGALKVAGGISTQENLHIGGVSKVYGTTASDGKTAGALIVAGGVGVSGALFGAAATLDGVVTLTDDTTSTSATTGALKVTGGISTQENLNVGGDLKVDTSVLVVNSTTNRVGINKATPGYTLDVDGDINFTGTFREDGNPFVSTPWTIETSPDALNYTAGNVGIGATDPAAKLTVTGDAQITTTLSVGGVVTLTDATESTSSTTGALKAAGGVGIAKDVFVGERAYVTGGLITNTGGVGKKTYSYSADLGSGASVANSTYVLDFTNHPFHAKVTAMLIESDDEISTLIFDVIGGKIGGGSNSAYVPALGMTSIISTSTMNTHWDPAIATSLTGTTVTIKPANACSGVVRFNIFVEYLSHETAGRLTSVTNSGSSAGTGDFGY